MELIELIIEKIAFGGAGFGHVNGKACFVPFTMPGDIVRAKVKVEKKSYIKGELVELLSIAPDRVAPKCSSFGECGGCMLQHIPYDRQLEIKEELFAEQLWRFARVDRSKIETIQGANPHWSYRTRVQVKISLISKNLRMGFFRSCSHFIVPFPDSCAIASQPINLALGELHDIITASPEPDKIPQVDIANSDDGKVIVIIHYVGIKLELVSRYFSRTCKDVMPSANGLWIQYGRANRIKLVHGIERLSYNVSLKDRTPLRLSFNKGGFSQINYLQNEHLVRAACEMAGLSGCERVLDIYCGNGNFSLPMATISREVVGLEEYRPSIDAASENAISNNILNASFYCTDAAHGVANLVKTKEHFDVVVLDPPRSGAANIMELIPLLGPDKIVYISCDPATLARDVAILKKLDYSVSRSKPIDMFPQTGHMESVTLIERN